MDVLKKIFDNESVMLNEKGINSVGENINTFEGPQVIRKYSKYTVEMLSDAYDLFRDHGHELNIHTHEKLVEAIHFYVEKLIIANLTYDKILLYLNLKSSEEFWENVTSLVCPDSVEESLWRATYWINITDTRLNDEILNIKKGNEEQFYKENSFGFLAFIVCLIQLGLDQNSIWQYYSKIY